MPTPADSPEPSRLSVSDVRSRGTLTVEEAAAFLNIGRSSAYQAVQRGDLPVIRIGRRCLVPAARLLALLGIRPDTSNPATTSTPTGEAHARKARPEVLQQQDRRHRPPLLESDVTADGTDAAQPR